ncbi:MAG: class II aldolase/adducin family protein [Deltaproteobacteria bacterium]|nr:class II aldolase/adducin family protein [Deltaproteobacteria bacterium]MBW2398850.1 class II aldolase/adducin family protein [Deltaproteobacteria bacterium]
MDSRFLIGLDFGGGGGRCLVIDVESRAMTVAFRTWTFESPSDLPTASDVDAERCWELLCECVREVLERSGAKPEQVVGIAATSMRHASAVLDSDGNLLLATSNRDARGLAEALRLGAESGEELHRRTGHWPNPVQAAGRLLWLKQQANAGWDRAATHLSLGDWLGFRLCGELATDPSQASETLLLDLAEGDWAWDLIDRLELPRSLFPEVCTPGSRLGELAERAAADLGLPAGIPVGVGGGDTQCGLLGAGVTRPGEMGVILGTTAPVQLVVDRPLLDDSARLWSAHHMIPGQWVIESNAGGVGTAAEWVAGLLFPDTPWPLGHLFAEAECSLPGAAGMVSTLGADVMDARKLGLPIGNLTLSPMGPGDSRERRQHLARSIVEGIAFGLRANIEQAEAVAGCAATRIHVAGGLARSAFFTQTLSDVLDRPVDVGGTPEATALGAAICAGVAAGVYPDLAAGAAALATSDRSCEPTAAATIYSELYGDWNGLRLARAESDAAASALAIKGLLSQPQPVRQAETSNDARPRILVTAEMDEAGLAGLQRIGDVEHVPFKKAMRLLTGRTLAEALAGVEVFVTEIDVVDAVALSEADDLRIVATCRGDAVNVDIAACSDLGIPVLNAPGRNADAVADLTLTYLLMLARRMPEAAAFLREPGGEAGDMGRMGRAFKQLQGRELWRKTIGLVGMGAVGRKVIERLRPFGVHCLVHDPYVDADRIRLAGAEPASLAEVLERSDFVSLHAAVSDETTGMIGAAEIARMRAGSCLVNTARAALIDQDALVDALEAGHLAGAAMDVFSVEPPASDDPLLALDNVIATPHIGGNTAEVASHQGRIIAADLERMRAGVPALCLLNPDVLADFDWTQPRTPPTAEQKRRLLQRPPPAVTDLEKKGHASTRTSAAPAAAPSAIGPSSPIPDSNLVELRSSMERVLTAFAHGLVNDEALREAGSGREVVLHFIIIDLDLEIHFGFAPGGLIGGIGAPDDLADVQLKMRADMFDGMFTGRTNPMQAAMEGDISFSGDTAKAMTLTEIQADMERVYRAAIAEVGEPGDLSSIPRPDESGPATGATPADSATVSVRTGTPVSGIPASDARHQLVEIVNELYATQLITATGGNVSVRTGTPGEAWITPSQLFKGDLAPEILVRIGMDGRALDPAARSPSSEAPMHTAVFEAKPEAQAIIHCHAPNATILANTGLPFLPISTEAAFLVNIGRIPFVMPGTADLATAVVEAMGDGWAVLMQNHGVLVAGRSLRRAADMAEIIERTAEVILGCYAVGREPPVLPEETVRILSKMGDLMA